MAVEPELSPVLSGGKGGPHKIQGIGAGFIPAIVDVKCIDEVVTVNQDVAMETAKRSAKEEGNKYNIKAEDGSNHLFYILFYYFFFCF